jgi:quercetin dioxygenase-like cupin family protein
MIENPRTGEQIDFLDSDTDVLTMRSVWTRPGHRAPEHLHPSMEETFTVVSGQPEFRVDGRTFTAAPGDIVVVPPGVPHAAWNAGADPVVVVIDMRPPLRWREFTVRLFAQEEDPRLLLEEYDSEVRVTQGPPRPQ